MVIRPDQTVRSCLYLNLQFQELGASALPLCHSAIICCQFIEIVEQNTLTKEVQRILNVVVKNWYKGALCEM